MAADKSYVERRGQLTGAWYAMNLVLAVIMIIAFVFVKEHSAPITVKKLGTETVREK